mgnify:FL=1
MSNGAYVYAIRTVRQSIDAVAKLYRRDEIEKRGHSRGGRLFKSPSATMQRKRGMPENVLNFIGDNPGTTHAAIRAQFGLSHSVVTLIPSRLHRGGQIEKRDVNPGGRL